MKLPRQQIVVVTIAALALASLSLMSPGPSGPLAVGRPDVGPSMLTEVTPGTLAVAERVATPLLPTPRSPVASRHAGASVSPGARVVLAQAHRGSVSVRFHLEGVEDPVVGVRCLLHQDGSGDTRLQRVALSDSHGVARFDGLSPGEVRVSSLLARTAVRWLWADQQLMVPIAVAEDLPTATIKVVDWRGAPCSRAEILVGYLGKGRAVDVVGLCDVQGMLRIEAFHPGLHFAARSPGLATTTLRRIDRAEPGTPQRFELREARRLDCHVSGQNGRPIESVRVRVVLRDRGGAGDGTRSPTGLAPPDLVATTNVHGLAVFDELRRGWNYSIVVRVDRYALLVQDLLPGLGLMRLVVTPELPCAGVVRDEAGRPLAGAAVVWQRAHSARSSHARTDALGRFQLRHVGRVTGGITLRALKRGFHPTDLLGVPADHAGLVELRMERLRN